MESKDRPIGVDLFAGAGGMTLGFEQAGFDVLAAVELDPIHCATHEFNFPFFTILCQSVVDITGQEIRSRSAIGNRDIDVVFGGSPCQGFSLMGKRALDEPRNTLIFDFLRLVVQLNPKFFVMENVPGIFMGKHQDLFLKVIEDFNSNGYEVETNYQVLNAASYGVPQDRARLFLIGCRKGLSLPKYPHPLTVINPQNKKYKPQKYLKVGSRHLDTNENSKLFVCPTVLDAIGDLPEVEAYPELLKRDWTIAQYGKPSNYALQMRGMYPDLNDQSYEREFKNRILTSSMRSQHSPECIERFSKTNPGEIEKISRFYKLHSQGICNTLRAGTPSNRGAFTSPRPIHPFTPRCITVREAARLHSYPDWFRFHVTKWHGFRQVGNSVPPLLAKAVAAEIICALGVSPVKPIGKRQLGDEQLLQLNMSQAAERYGVDAHVIEPRIRRAKKQMIQLTTDN